MKRVLTLAAIVLFALTLTVGCGGKEGGGGGGDGDNPFAARKASLESYLAAVEGAGGDGDKAIAAGQAWLDANLAGYKANCTKLLEYRQDLKKSELATGIETPFEEYMDRANKAGGFDPKQPDMAKMRKAADLLQQFNTFFNCDALMQAP